MIFKDHNIIAVDCDEILSHTLQAGLDLHNGCIAGMSFSRNDIKDYFFHDYIDGFTEQDAIDFFHTTFHNDLEDLEIEPLADALHVLQKLKGE